MIASSTDYTDHGGGYGAGRLGRLFGLACEQRWPLVLFVDGGGSRARHPRMGMGHIETSGPIGRFSFLDGIPELSGWAPVVAIVSGPSFAGIDAAKRYLSFYDNDLKEGQAPDVDLDALAPDAGETYDMREIVVGLCDADSVFELRPQFARSLLTCLARIGGRTVGVLANQPLVDDGAIDHGTATKIARFVELCNTYEYPMLALIDTPGCVANWTLKGQPQTVAPGLTRWHARPLIAHQQRTVPLLSVQICRGRGLGAALMTGVSTTRGVPALRLGWPGVEIGHRDGFSAVVDHNAFDDVIAPRETRGRLERVLRLLGRPRQRSEKKHPIDTW